MTKKTFARRLYKNAPIIEAVISLGFSAADDFDLSKLEATIRKKCSKEYPNVTKEISNQFRLESGENPQSEAIASQTGLCFVSSDQKKIFKIQNGRFSFSRLKPYENWNLFQDEAEKVFLICQDAFSIKDINMTSVRYINRFDLPGDSIDLADYFSIFPQISDDFKIRSLAMQLILDQPDISSTLVISQALIPPLKPETISILLDINLFNNESCQSKDIWGFIKKLQTRKNEIFEKAITDKTRDLIS